MRSNIESVWLFALASKCRAFSQESFAFSVFIIFLAWLVMTLFYWAHPGGPAWGKFSFLNPSFLSAVNKRIPGPRGLPVIGSMNLMASSLAHHRIAAAAEACKAKRLMAFSLGHTRVLVTCNPDVAREMLNSSVFADRPVKESAYSLMFNRAIGFAPYGVYWRTLRRIAAMHLFCPKQIKGAEDQRREIASEMVSLYAQHDRSFSVRQVLKRASLNNMMASIFGRKYKLNSTNNEVEQLQALVDEGLDPQQWAHPLEFIPDRFVSKEGEVEFSVLGSDLRLAPFGSGRRTCPGKKMGLTTVSFWVATLVHEFEWLPSDQNTIDLSEVLRLSCEMLNPLTVKVRPRLR
ncbi:hypothetical protein V6N13_131984 [Hibiscus sabdariffa]|uniref:Uncharacterized protein n=1 Tax=Hibiscus sabdariffa TaxID=183260 RepID=A0ABR2NII7_9ROSI